MAVVAVLIALDARVRLAERARAEELSECGGARCVDRAYDEQAKPEPQEGAGYAPHPCEKIQR
jgi:hypothetical protein